MPSSSTTTTRNGSTTVPTDPGCESQSAEEMRQRVPDSLPPYDSTRTGPNHSIMARFTSGGQADPVCATSFRLETSADARTSGSAASRRWKCVGTMTDEVTR